MPTLHDVLYGSSRPEPPPPPEPTADRSRPAARPGPHHPVVRPRGRHPRLRPPLDLRRAVLALRAGAECGVDDADVRGRFRRTPRRLRARRRRRRPHARAERGQGLGVAVRPLHPPLRHLRHGGGTVRRMDGATPHAGRRRRATSSGCRSPSRPVTTCGPARRCGWTSWSGPTRWRRRWCDPATTRACSRHSSWRSASPPPPPRRPACSSSTRSHRPAEPIEGWSADEG